MAAPTVYVWEFATSGIDPGSVLYNNRIGTKQETDGDALSFGTINIDETQQSDTKTVVFMVTSLNGNSYVDNVRFWAPSVVAGSLVSYNWDTSRVWVQNAQVTATSGTVPTSLPTSYNVEVSGTAAYIANPSRITASGGFAYTYLSLTFDPDIEIASYGGSTGSGILRYRFTYDYGV